MVATVLAAVMAVPGMATQTTTPESKENPDAKPVAKENLLKPRFVTKDA
jgi:hypothetical protein